MLLYPLRIRFVVEDVALKDHNSDIPFSPALASPAFPVSLVCACCYYCCCCLFHLFSKRTCLFTYRHRYRVTDFRDTIHQVC